MLRATQKTAALGAAVIVAAGLAACGSSASSNTSSSSSTSGLSAGTVASVDGAPISAAAFAHWMTVASAASNTSPTQPVVVPDPPSYSKCIAHLRTAVPAKGAKPPTTAALKTECQTEYNGLRDEVLNFLINADWIIGEAGRHNLTVKDATVTQQLAALRKKQFPTAAQFSAYLASTHQTRDDLLLQVKINDLSVKLRNRAIKGAQQVSAAKIAAYYKAHKQTYGQAAKRNLSIILVKTRAQALAAKRAVTSGTPFAAEAKKVSIDPATKALGGLETGVAKGQEEQALDTAVFSAPLNVVTGPVSTPFGFYVFRVHSATPASQKTLAQVSSTIRSQLAQAQEQAKLQTWVKGFELRWTAMTNCNSGFIIQDCKQYKKPSAATGTTGVGG